MHELYRIIEWKFGLPVAAGLVNCDEVDVWWVYRPSCLPVATGSVNCDEGDEYTAQDVYL